MSRYPEWFIGGPWHGKDKLTECPNLPGPIRVAVEPDIQWGGPSPVAHVTFDEITYVRQTFIMGREHSLTVWVPESDLPVITSDASSAALSATSYRRILDQLMDLIMKPHERINGRPGYDLDPFTGPMRAAWAESFPLEEQIRTELRGQYEDRIRRLQQEIIRLQGQQTITRSELRYSDLQGTDQSAAAIELLVNGEWLRDSFDSITLYLDQGDGTEDNPPSWVANAQGDHSPVTGYGTTPKAAIVAMLADAVDIYARMIDTSEKPRLK